MSENPTEATDTTATMTGEYELLYLLEYRSHP